MMLSHLYHHDEEGKRTICFSAYTKAAVNEFKTEKRKQKKKTNLKVLMLVWINKETEMNFHYFVGFMCYEIILFTNIG